VPPKLFKNPTVGEFIAEAIAQGAVLLPRGNHPWRVLSGKNGVLAVVMEPSDQKPLTSAYLELLCRALQITGYEHLYLWHGEE
jgi:hypothetical protein